MTGKFAGIIVVLACFSAAVAADKAQLNFGRDVRPILSENCFPCHGQDTKKRMAGLRLDSFEGATADRGGHAALVPGKPEASLLYQRITAPPARRMPPGFSNHTLTPEQIATLKRWIEEGGHYAKHWAFVPPARPEKPETSNPGWVKQPIDAFVLQRLDAEGLHPSPEATPGVWLRRVSLDLVGLPPTPAEIDSFADDAKRRGDAAYSDAVDRLLASPRYGERMAMDWLDVARYADTHGFNNDASRSMWRWRDWVIDSFNANMPYDRFITEQLAGDLLPNPTMDQLIATGFGRNHVINSEGGIIDEEYRSSYVTDRVRTLGMAWMGLTLECAHCHDHKFDPLTQNDHYRFYAFFNNIAEMGEDGRVANAMPTMQAPTRAQQQRMRELDSELSKLARQIHQADLLWNREAARGGVKPAGAELEMSCDGGCRANADTKPMTGGKGVRVPGRDPATFAFWLRPEASDTDVALLSTMDYATNAAATTYGKGIELRLAGGELEFRLSERFPGYSIRVRSKGAQIEPGQWRHLTLTYRGAVKDSQRAEAAWVRMFADGRELPIEILNDDLGVGELQSYKPQFVHFRIGWDNSPGGAKYQGEFDELAVWTRALEGAEIRGWLKRSDPGADLRTELLRIEHESPSVMIMRELEKPRETHVLMRGAYNAPGDKVEPGVPEELLGAWPEGAPKNRLGLARWLTKPDHPLTGRVVVNRFWQQLFGVGIVKTSDNFGLQGEWPSHPELLDWLAREFVDSGWNVKGILKEMVLSATYRQDSSASKELVARDPENRLLARGPRFRLPAEMIRDEALEISGLLKNRLGGPSVFPYQPKDLYKGIVVAADYPGTKYVESTGDDLYRRSLYTFWKRTVPHPTMTVFDAPDREFCVVRRSTTNTPLQALTLLNDPTFVEAARKLAERSLVEGGSTAESRLGWAFRMATGRAADGYEMSVLGKTLDQMLASYGADPKGAEAFVSTGASPWNHSIDVVELAAYTAVANMILNMDEVITKG